MTGKTAGLLMGARQLKAGSFKMVKTSPLPGFAAMALLANGRKSKCKMAGIARLFIIPAMTIITVGLGAAIAAGVASGTFQIGMPAGEGKGHGMIESGPFPGGGIGQMTFLAIEIETRFLVRRRQRFHKVGQMTPLAIYRCIAETMAGSLFPMAGGTFQVGMDPHQGKVGCAVRIQHIHAVFPTGGGMAGFAAYPQFILMDIGMTIDTTNTDTVKYQALMTLAAGNIPMLPDQGITGPVMIKFIGVDRIKITGGMAGGALQFQPGAMGIAGTILSIRQNSKGQDQPQASVYVIHLFLQFTFI